MIAVKRVFEPPRAPFVAMASGRSVSILNPASDQIHLDDICHGLARTFRFGGQTKINYSVAQHLVNGAEAVLQETDNPRLAAYFLIHDFAEYVTGDQTRPFIQAANASIAETRKWRKGVFSDSLTAIEENLNMAIYGALNIASPSQEQIAKINAFDLRMLADEKRVLFPNSQNWDGVVEGQNALRHWRGAWKEYAPEKMAILLKEHFTKLHPAIKARQSVFYKPSHLEAAAQ